MTTKTTRIIDLNLFSGSSELLRQAAGGYYSDIAGNGDISFVEPVLADIGGVESVSFSEANTTSSNILPRIQYASRLYVDEAAGFVSDEDWRTFVVGGEYGDKTYSGLYNDSVYADHANTSSLPYVPREIVNIDSIEPSLLLTTEYYNYYPRYQSTVGRLDSELSAPNFYLLDSSSYLEPIDLGNTSTQSKYAYRNLSEYLTSSYVNSTEVLNTNLENIFVLDDTALERNAVTRLDTADLNGHFDGDLESLYSLMPFGNKLEIRRDLLSTSDDFRTIIQDANYQLKFIKLLKEVFQGESGLQPASANFAVNTESEASTGVLTGSLEVTNTISTRLVDVPTMLLYAYRNPTSETNNISVINSGSFENQIDYAMDVSGTYRYENTEVSLSVLNDFVSEIENKFDTTTETYDLQNFLNQAGTTKYYETVAFRIEKIGGPPTGDSRTENVIQNIWFYNTNNAITYLDTQVKYNTEYTYKIYKYDIVQGYKYRLSDVVVTRQIATETSGTSTVYCLEFYNPLTGETRNQLISDENLGTRFEEFTSLTEQLEDRRSQYINTSLTEQNWANNPLNLNSAQKDIWRDMLARRNDLDGNLTIIVGRPVGERSRNPDAYTQFKEQIENWIINVQGKDCRNYFAWVVYGGYSGTGVPSGFNNTEITVCKAVSFLNYTLIPQTTTNLDLYGEITSLEQELEEASEFINAFGTNAQINSTRPYLADFNITIEPSVKIVEIPLEEKSMRIVDHPPNDFVVTPHHLLDQSNRLAFYCKYDTFSQNAVTYPTALNARDTNNKTAYLTGNDFLEVSEQTQESVSRPRFIEVYRTTTKPTSYDDFSGNLRTTIDLKQENGDIPTDHLFVERVRDNTIYYYVFRSLNENGIAGQFSPVFESELINDGGYAYGRFQQHSEEDLAVVNTQDPLSVVKKLFNIVPNIQHLVLDSSNADLENPSVSEIDNISLGSSNLTDPLFTDDNRYFKIRLTSKKTGRKLDINIGFKKEVRK